MYGLDVERRLLGHRSLSRDIANNLYEHLKFGSIVVAASHPSSLFASVKKQWKHNIHRLQVERARTLNSQKIHDLNNHIMAMEWTSFSAKLPADTLEADITFATPDQLVRFAPMCKTLYATYDFPREKLHMMTSRMPRSGKVIIYDEG